MSWLKEFRDFAVRGNVIDLAVGIVIGAAFSKIVSSLVGDIITPTLGLLAGTGDLGALAYTLRPAVGDDPAAVLHYGAFLQSVLDFLIVGFAIFLLVRAINRLRHRKEAAKAAAPPPPPPPPSKQEVLLTEIRDLLRQR